MSGGFSDTNTLQQGRDLLDIVSSLRTGAGMRALSPSGVLSTGAAAATAVRGAGAPAALPTPLMGSSRGSMATGSSLPATLHKDCASRLADKGGRPPAPGP